MRKMEITIVPKEVGELWDDILQNVLGDVCRRAIPVPDRPLSELIPHVYHPSYNVHHVKCYQQRTGNLCGYHAAFNTLCFLSLLHGGQTHYDILSGASFWSFKRRIEQFLFEVKARNRLADEWPWKEQDILHGDFERTYNRLCLEHAPDFAIFREQDHYQFLSFTWEFQYENLLLSEEKRRELNRLIAHFRGYKAEQPLVVGFMLAITNHWMLLVAVKTRHGAQYWFFDSSNRDFLELNHQQIDELVERLDQERKDLGREAFSQFFKKNMGVCMRDTQISLRLIVDCLEGKTTIEEYTYNQQFALFAGKMEKHWDHDPEGTEHIIKEYWYNITAFFRMPLQRQLLTPENQKRLAKMIQVSHEMRQRSEHGNRLNSLVKKYSQQTRM